MRRFTVGLKLMDLMLNMESHKETCDSQRSFKFYRLHNGACLAALAFTLRCEVLIHLLPQAIHADLMHTHHRRQS